MGIATGAQDDNRRTRTRTARARARTARAETSTARASTARATTRTRGAQEHKSSARAQDSTRGAQEHRGIDSDSSSNVTAVVIEMVSIDLGVYMYASLSTHLFQFLAPSGSRNRGVVLCCGVVTAGNMG